MMLHEMNSRQIRLGDSERGRKRSPHLVNFLEIPCAIHDVRDLHSVRHGEGRLAKKIRSRVAADRDVGKVQPRDSFDLETFPDGLGGEPRPVLYAAKPLFFQRDD